MFIVSAAPHCVSLSYVIYESDVSLTWKSSVETEEVSDSAPVMLISSGDDDDDDDDM